MSLHKHIKKLSTLSLAVAAAAILWLALSTGDDQTAARAQTGDTPTPVSPLEPFDEPGDQQLPAIQGKVNPPQYSNMDSNLNQIVEQAESGRFTAQAAAANAPIHSGASVAVTLYITEGYADAIADYLSDNGASPRNIGADYIEAYIPVTLLADASQQEGVISIQTIVPAQPAQGAVVSDGVSLHGATAWHAAGLKGQGVRIGIIDTGFQGFQTLMGTELPASVEARCYTDIGVFTSNPADCTDSEDAESRRLHGTAVTEAVFDIAPEATYYISNTSSWADLKSSVEWMVDHDVDVINHSVGWLWGGPGDGTSPYSNSPLGSVDTAVAGGITWANAAGNSATGTWFSGFTDTDSDKFHEFSGDDDCNNYGIYDDSGQIVPAIFTREVELSIQLRWDDTWGGASKDLDLYLYKWNENTQEYDQYTWSEEEQSGGENHIPFERISEAVPPGAYCLAVKHYEGSIPNWIQLQDVRGFLLEHHTLRGSIGSPAESANLGMLAVGASPAFDINSIEPYSSQGPTPDGRVKPDIVGVTRGQSVSYRSDNRPDGRWGGTSQASPHVAGLAALVKQNYPAYTPQQVTNYLKTHAEERGAAGPDNVWGYGFARLRASDAPSPSPSPSPSPLPTPGSNCVEPLNDRTTVNGTWASGCNSIDPADDGGDRYARFYTFTLSQSGNVNITLSSDSSNTSDIDTYLYLRQGTGRSATPYCENDDYANLIGTRCELIDSTLSLNTDSGLVAKNLPAGSYTIEATTYESSTGEGKLFTLTVNITGATAPPPVPSPSPVPTPSPTPGDITKAVCTEDDITSAGVQGYALDETVGPDSYAAGYWGTTARYATKWHNASDNTFIDCYAWQFDNKHNARWNGLSYPNIKKWQVGSLGATEHEQIFIGSVGHDMVAYRVGFLDDGVSSGWIDVRFLNAETNILTSVVFWAINIGNYNNTQDVYNIAKNIADRVIPSSESQSQTPAWPGGMLDLFHRIE